MHYSPDAIRTIALVGHAGCGKTSLVEALLHQHPRPLREAQQGVIRSQPVLETPPTPQEPERQVEPPLTLQPFHEHQHSVFDANLRFINTRMRCVGGEIALPEGPGLGVEPKSELWHHIVQA